MSHGEAGCSIPVVHALRVRKDRVRFSAARPSGYLNGIYQKTGRFYL